MNIQIVIIINVIALSSNKRGLSSPAWPEHREDREPTGLFCTRLIPKGDLRRQRGRVGEPLPHQQGNSGYMVLGQVLGRDQGISEHGVGDTGARKALVCVFVGWGWAVPL